MVIRWERAAEKHLARLDIESRIQIRRVVLRYAAEGLGDVKALKGKLAGQRRLSTGRWRIFFTRERDVLTVRDFEDRGKAYR